MNADLIITLALAIIWGSVYYLFPFLRRELWLTSIAGLLLLPISIFIITDSKELSAIFSLLSTFFIFFSSGLAGIIFHVLVGLDYEHIKSMRNKKRHQADLWLLRFILITIGFSWLTIIFHLFFALTTSFSILFASIIIALYIIIDRRDLAIDALISGFLMSFITFSAGLLAILITGEFSSLLFSGDLFLGLPQDLLIYSFALGLGLSPIYEYTRQFHLKQNDSQ